MTTKESLVEIKMALEKQVRGLNLIVARLDDEIAAAKTESTKDAAGFRKPAKPKGSKFSAESIAWEKWECLGNEFTIKEVREKCNSSLTNPAFYHVLSRWEKMGLLKTRGHGMGATATKYFKVKA